MTAAEASDRLSDALAEQRSIELDPSVRTRRRLAGRVTGDRVWVRADDANWTTRRKSWNVELSARLEELDDGAALSGVIDIADRRALGRLMVLFQLIAVILGVIGLAIAARAIAERGELTFTALLPLVVVAGLVVGRAYVEREGELAAGEDAALLEQSVHTILNPGD